MKNDAVEWEMFEDMCYYDMYAVRPVGDKAFDSPRLFHFSSFEDARACRDLLNKAYCAREVV